jgi:hypothetical protein
MHMMENFYIYTLSSKKRGTLYVGLICMTAWQCDFKMDSRLRGNDAKRTKKLGEFLEYSLEICREIDNMKDRDDGNTKWGRDP